MTTVLRISRSTNRTYSLHSSISSSSSCTSRCSLYTLAHVWWTTHNITSSTTTTQQCIVPAAQRLHSSSLYQNHNDFSAVAAATLDRAVKMHRRLFGRQQCDHRRHRLRQRLGYICCHVLTVGVHPLASGAGPVAPPAALVGVPGGSPSCRSSAASRGLALAPSPSEPSLL